MEYVTFTCETITPMFLTGADGKTPELRAPSIKGVLRFWWRALNGHLSLEELKRRETEIFGGTDPARRSRVVVRVEKPLTETEAAVMLPHKERTRRPPAAFRPNQEFVVSFFMPSKIIDSKTGEDIFSIERMKTLFLLVSVLGGLGKRVRRGFGSFKVTKIGSEENSPPRTINQVYELLKILSPSFYVLNDTVIVFTYNGKTTPYPFIKEIEIGLESDNLLRKIGRATHDYKAKDKYKYEASLGHAFKGRFASPVFVSVLDEKTPIITSLNTVPDKNEHQVSRILQEDFKKAILK